MKTQVMIISIPHSNKAWTRCTWPSAAAKCRAVHPFLGDSLHVAPIPSARSSWRYWWAKFDEQHWRQLMCREELPELLTIPNVGIQFRSSSQATVSFAAMKLQLGQSLCCEYETPKSLLNIHNNGEKLILLLRTKILSSPIFSAIAISFSSAIWAQYVRKVIRSKIETYFSPVD